MVLFRRFESPSSHASGIQPLGLGDSLTGVRRVRWTRAPRSCFLVCVLPLPCTVFSYVRLSLLASIFVACIWLAPLILFLFQVLRVSILHVSCVMRLAVHASHVIPSLLDWGTPPRLEVSSDQGGASLGLGVFPFPGLRFRAPSGFVSSTWLGQLASPPL